MLKLTKKADYGLIALKHLAESGTSSSAKDIGDEYGLPQEALAKILQRLTKSGLLVSQHGTNGGYSLARPAGKISALEVIKAIDGPLFITACSSHNGECDQSSKCNVKEPLRKVNHGIRELLAKISIADMMEAPLPVGAEAESESKTRISHSNLVTLA
ncbi:MAG TPA: Rrf2 family transcriptional regulator [Terriglobales bacterium]|nr:Rrf2 family transcriptional regulator [Terriglobales bacterium]